MPTFNGFSPEECEARARARRMACYDALPARVRTAIRTCDIYLDILIPTRGFNWDMVLDRIQAVKTHADGARFMRDFAR